MQRRAFLLASAGIPLAGMAQAEAAWPTRPIRLVIPYAAGGGIDVVTRKLAEKVGSLLGQSVFVDNKVGAGGAIGAELVAQAKPDGYTLLLATSSHVTLKAMAPNTRFDPLTSFEHVTQTTGGQCVLVVAQESPYRTVQDLVAAIRREPGKFNYASGGIGTPSHLAAAAMVTHLKLSATHVPYRGSVEIAPALISGDAQFAFPVPATAVPLIQQGKLRPLAVSGPTRLPQLANVPTLKEIFNSNDVVIDGWSGIWAPAGTPQPILAKLNNAILKALADKTVMEHYQGAGSQIATTRTPAEFTRFVQAETVKYVKLVAAAGITTN